MSTRGMHTHHSGSDGRCIELKYNVSKWESIFISDTRTIAEVNIDVIITGFIDNTTPIGFVGWQS